MDRKRFTRAGGGMVGVPGVLLVGGIQAGTYERLFMRLVDIAPEQSA